MNNLDRNSRNDQHSYKKNSIDERFEQNAGVKIHKGKESYGGGSGFYAVKAKPNCPNVNDGGRCDTSSGHQSK
jgi:hypothetical protein